MAGTRHIIFVVAVFAVATLIEPVRAQNLVQDPGFESAVPGQFGYVNAPGYFSDGVWQVTYATCAVQVNNAHTGNHCALVGFLSFAGTLQQTLPTQAAESYDLDFYYTTAPYPLIVDFGGNQVAYTTTPGSPYNEGFASGLVATGASTSLSFNAPIGEELLDDVSVTLVPEPLSLGLLGTAGIGMLSRRRRLI
jgi:hypothetical protein